MNIEIEVTSRCNLNCTMCSRAWREHGDMPEERVRKILKQAPDDTRVWYSFLGEPLLVGRLPDYIRYGNKCGMTKHCLNTNGMLLTKDLADKLVDAGLTEIYISLDAVTEGTYNKIRRGGDFHTVVKNIESILENHSDNLQITVQAVETPQNKHEIKAFKEKWKEHAFIKKLLLWSAPGKTRTQRYPCPWFDAIGVFWDGSIPMCVNSRKAIAHIDLSTLKEAREFQMRFYKMHAKRDWKSIPAICKECVDWAAKSEREVK